MKTSHVVHDYFERESRRFDAIYDQDKPVVQRLVDRLFRGVILERFRLDLQPGADTRTVVGARRGVRVGPIQRGACHGRRLARSRRRRCLVHD